MNWSEIKLLAFFYSEVCLNGVGLKESYEFSFQCGFLCSPLMKNEPIRDHMVKPWALFTKLYHKEEYFQTNYIAYC